MKFVTVLLAVILTFPALARENKSIVIGSKAFTESYLLAEMAAQLLEGAGYKVDRRFGMGGTGILFQALTTGEVDLYFEYTGTISQAILKDSQARTWREIKDLLVPLRMDMSRPLGFENNYAIAVRKDWAQDAGVHKLSQMIDLAKKPVGGFSHEFVTRSDGLPGLEKHYDGRITSKVNSMEHSLVYVAIENGSVDIMDVYTTDAKIERLDLKILEDDRKFFPSYEAVILSTLHFTQNHPEQWAILKTLEGSLTESTMRRLTGLVDIDKRNYSEVAGEYLGAAEPRKDVPLARIFLRTKEHLALVLASLLAAILVGFPLGLIAHRKKKIGQSIVLISSVIQTVPSLALLCFLIPLFGIGTWPALVALFLYSLLPIVMGTTVGLRSIDSKLYEVCHVLNIHGLRRLAKIEIPLASVHILSGIRTSAIISIGTATLAALIGAGGYGVPIVTGLAINDMNTILIGAVPAAALAIVTHGFFEALDKLLIPKGLRQKSPS